MKLGASIAHLLSRSMKLGALIAHLFEEVREVKGFDCPSI